MKLSEMRELLSTRQIQLTKSLGQNFLHDVHQLRRIVDAAELQPTDKVLEIGPGLGPLTELLLEKSGEVLAIEKDTRLVEVLRERFPSKLELLAADALQSPDNPVRPHFFDNTDPDGMDKVLGQIGARLGTTLARSSSTTSE